MRPVFAPLLVLALAVPFPLLAEHGEKGNKHKGKKDDTASISVTFSVDQRDHVRSYFVEKHGRGNCPPGLAKKNRQCLPPGQLKKRYAVGHPLPAGVEVLAVPQELVVQIGPPPSGYRYGLIDGDVVELVVGTLLVVDAIDGLVD
jgi:hypothetical protein